MGKVIKRIENGVISARACALDEIGFIVSSTEPTNPHCGDLWVDTAFSIPVVKIYNCNVSTWASGALPVGVYYLGGNTTTVDGAGENWLATKVIDRLSSDTACAAITAQLNASTGVFYHSSERLGSIIYQMGGYCVDAVGTYMNKLYSDSVCKLSAVKSDPDRIYQSSGTISSAAYFFGGNGPDGVSPNYNDPKRDIRKLLIDDTWSLLSISLSTSRRETSGATMRDVNKIYVAGGYDFAASPKESNVIEKLESDSTISSAGTLATSKRAMGSAYMSSAVYIAGGQTAAAIGISTIERITSSDVVQTCSASLSATKYDVKGATYGNYAYFMGGYTSGAAACVSVFEKMTSSTSISTLSANLTAGKRYGSASSSG